MRIITVNEFPAAYISLLEIQHRQKGNPGGKKKVVYLDCISAFDIESTRLADIEQSFMYIWQWCFWPEFVVVGRSWEEFAFLVERISAARKDDYDKLVVWVHNLSYEFQFLRGVHRFSPDDVFAIKSRKILKAVWDKIEFRCSYLLCNMSLDEYCRKMGVEHQKLHGFDYTKIRYPWTELTEFELQYCIHDVIGLCEALSVEMSHDGDNLYTIPPTSTGYVRRDAKHAMRAVSPSYVKRQLVPLDIFEECREAFRGGDTHGSRFFAGQVVHDGDSADRSSSYPDIVCNCKFPVSEFFRHKGNMSVDDVLKLIVTRGLAVIMRVRMWDVRLAEYSNGAPYLSRDKCRNILSGEFDNGRVLRADYLETTLTDIDLKIVLREYRLKAEFFDVCHARYGYLPDALRQATIKYYRDKTELKNVEGQEVYYMKAKNKLNAIYGMMAQNPKRLSIVYTQEGKPDKYGNLDLYPDDDTMTDQEILDKAYKNAFLCYQWGCWVTAWARYRLREAIWTVQEQGAEFLYCDTDSVKYLGYVDWSAYNAARIADSTASGAFATDPKGIMHYMGVMEQEPRMIAFKTWGAKKYIYILRNKRGVLELHSTIAGVAKRAGARELIKAGARKAFLCGLDGDAPLTDRILDGALAAFRPGFVFREAGGLEAIYNDFADIVITREGHKLHITSNVSLRPGEYTLGLAGDYERLLRFYKSTIDI